MDGSSGVKPCTREVGQESPAAPLDEGPGAGDAVARLFDEHGVGLLRYLGRRAGGGAAEDLVGDTFTVVIEQLAGFDPVRGCERAWIYGIATNLLRHHLRSQTRRNAATLRAGHSDVGLDVLDEQVAERVDAQRRVRQLSAAIQALTDQDRDVLLLIAWGGLTAHEVADALAIPAGTVRSRLHRARRQLRTAAPQTVMSNPRKEPS